MEVSPPPYPRYRDQGVASSREYRVTFWEQQLPPDGAGFTREEMGWTELTFDLAHVQDVQEAIEWAEAHIDEQLDADEPGRQHGERVYVLLVKVPDEEQYVQIAGSNPVTGSNAPHANLPRKRP